MSSKTLEAKLPFVRGSRFGNAKRSPVARSVDGKRPNFRLLVSNGNNWSCIYDDSNIAAVRQSYEQGHQVRTHSAWIVYHELIAPLDRTPYLVSCKPQNAHLRPD